MRPVERPSERVHRIEIPEREAYPFLRWLAPLLRWFHIDEFPAGPFLVVCAILGGVANYKVGILLLSLLNFDEPTTLIALLLLYILIGIAAGIGIAIKFINWLADHSPD